jgi:triacylglycerol lipase
MFIHGIGYTDDGDHEYWGRIPDVLKEQGADVYFGRQPSFGSTQENAKAVKETALEVLEETGAGKLNLIAHSKGGLEARYMVSCLDMAERTASLTTIATPHHGIRSMDRLHDKAEGFLHTLFRLFGTMLKVDGGEAPDEFGPYAELSEDYAKVFNELVPDAEGVYYQSYAFDMKNGASDPAMSMFHRIIKKREGPNDGFVSVDSAKWGEFKGVVSGPGNIGVSHPNAVDSRQKPVKNLKGEEFDITDLYVSIAGGLKEMGF